MVTDNRTTEYDAQKILLIVIAALTPCFMMGVYVFGLDMLDNMLGGCGSAVLMAWIIDMAGNRHKEKHDMEPELLAAAITGALVVFGTPSTLPIWIVLIGVAIAMIPAGFLVRQVQKKILSGYALKDSQYRPDNKPAGTADGVLCLLERAVITAAAAQAVIWILFRKEMSTWPLNDFVETRVSPGDVATGMTPLEILAEGGDLPGLSRMVIGFISGPCGEVSVAAAVIGGGYLIWKKIISPVVPACVLGIIFAAALVYYMTAMPQEELDAMLGTRAAGAGAALYMALYQVFAGGAVFGAFFLAPAVCLHKRASAPVRALIAAGTGIITVLLKARGIYVEGMAAPVLIMYVIVTISELLMLSRKNTTAVTAVLCMITLAAAPVLFMPENAEAATSKKYKYSVTVKEIDPEYVLPPGSTLKLSCKGKKKRGKVTKKAILAFKSSSSQIASVSQDGVVTAKKNGMARITVYCKAKKSVKKIVQIWVGQRIEDINLSGRTYLRTGRSIRLTTEIIPEHAANQNIVWASSDPDVAYISKTGKITAMSPGTAMISAASSDGSGISRTHMIVVYRLGREDARWIAHRGLTTEVVENTLDAFRKAGENGFWGAECDIWETKRDESGDFDLVISHDATYERVFGNDASVWDVCAPDVHEMISPDVCFLRDYLDVCREYGMMPVIEIKVSSDGLHGLTDEGAEKVLDTIEEVYGAEEAAALMDKDAEGGNMIHFVSFNRDMLLKVRDHVEKRYGTTPYTSLVTGIEKMESTIDAASEEGSRITAVTLPKSRLTKEVYDRCLSLGLRVDAWTYSDTAANDEYLYRHVASGEFSIESLLADGRLFE